MVPGVVSLRCPACARPFLILPQQEEAVVKCPHCGRSAPAASYGTAGAAPGGDLLRSLRERALHPPAPLKAPGAAATSWPAAPPLFAGPPPANTPPPAGDEPQWPFLAAPAETPPETPPKTSFSLAELKAPRGSTLREEDRLRTAARDVQDQERPERNVTLGLLLLMMALLGVWLLWLAIQPPMAVEIPVSEAPALGSGTPQTQASPQETAKRRENAVNLAR